MRTLRRSSDQCWMVRDTALGSFLHHAQCCQVVLVMAQLSDEVTWLNNSKESIAMYNRFPPGYNVYLT